MELYWGGLDGTAIARHLGVAEGTVHSWIHYLGHMRKRRRVPEVLALLPVTERLMAARSASEWQQTLRQAAPKGDKLPVRIFCGEVTGHSESNQLAAIVSEVLKRDPCDGTTYAFCSREKELISTIRWNNGAFCYTKQPKANGRYIWSDGEVGIQIDIRKNEFEYLLSLSKKRGQKPRFT